MVRLEQPDHPALARTLQRELEKIRADRVALLAKSPAKTYEEYRERCGVIEGLDIAIAQARLVAEKLNA